MKITLALVIGLSVSGGLFAQDPVKAAPDSYKLHFENEWVKILKVSYAAYSKVPIHDHSKWPAAYVYLTDSGPIRFVHAEWDDPVLTRPATKAKSFRLSPTTAAGERHMVENNGDLASEFLRIEFKKLKQGVGLPHRRVPARDFPKDTNSNVVDFEGERLRVTRLAIAAGKTLEIRPGRVHGMLVSLSRVKGTKTSSIPGEITWLKSNEKRALENDSQEPFEMLMFELLDPK